jgi:group I intron endonuclease
MKSGIYKITNIVNGKGYVGQSNNIKRRWMEHKTPAKRRGIVLDRAFAKYGIDNFEFSVLEYCKKSLLDEREIYYIKKLAPEYNMNMGGSGNGGRSLSADVRSRLSIASKKHWLSKTEEERQKILSLHLIGPKNGHAVSIETRQKISQKLKGRKTSSWQKKRSSEVNSKLLIGNCRGNKKVVQIDPSSKRKIKIHDSIKSAAECVGVHPSGITAVLKKRQIRSGGFLWEFCNQWSVETIPEGSRVER